MKNTRFPVTIGLISLPASSVSAQTVTVVRELLGKLQARSASGMTLILPNYRQLSEAFSSMTTGTGVRVVRLDPPANQVSSNEFSIVDLSDVVIAITGTDVDVIDRDPASALGYAQQLGRPTLTVDAETGALTGAIPEQLAVDQGWLPALARRARRKAGRRRYDYQDVADVARNITEDELLRWFFEERMGGWPQDIAGFLFERNWTSEIEVLDIARREFCYSMDERIQDRAA